MAKSFSCRSPCRNPLLTGKDEPAGPAPTKNSDTYTLAPTVSCTPTFVSLAAPAFAPAAVNSMVRYLEANFQQIFKTVLDTRSATPALQPLVFPDGLCERPLKANFPELYCGKTHMECYNII